jgi:hypothetical protein
MAVSQIAKSDKTLPVALNEADLKMLDAIADHDSMWPPSYSELARALLRYAGKKVLDGSVSLQQVHDECAVAPIGRI